MAFPPAAPPAPPLDDAPEDIIRAVAKAQGIDPDFALSIAQTESSMNPHTPPSSKGAVGLMQLMPATAARHKVNPNDPYENALGGVMELRDLHDAYGGDLEMMARRYNGSGPATTAYALKVLSDYEHRKGFAPGTLTSQLSRDDPGTAPKARPAAAAAKPGSWADPANLAAAAANPNAPPTPPWYQRAASTLGDVGVGALKGAGQTATNLGALVHKIPGVDAATEQMFHLPPGASQQAFAETNKDLEPTSTAQSVGKFGEQVGELIIPAGIVAKEAYAAQKLAAPALTAFVGKTAANAIPRVAVEAAGGAGMAAAQGGDPKVGAAFGAAAPAIGGVADALADTAAGAQITKAKKLVEQAFHGTGQRYKAMAQKRVQEILDRGLWGSRDAMVKEAEQNIVPATQAIEDIMHAHGNQPFTGSQAMLRYLETVKDKFRRFVPGPQGPVEVPIDKRPLQELSKLQDTLTALGPRPTMEDMVAVRRVWDNTLAEIGAFAHRAPGAIGLSLRERTEEWAKFKGANFLRGLLGQDLPALVKPNHDYSFWTDVHDVLTQTMQREGPQGPGLGATLAHIGARTAGAAATAMGLGVEHAKYTTPGLIAYGVAEAGNLAHQVMTTPAWRMASAQLRNAFGEALNRNDTGALAEIGALITGARVAQPPPPPPPGHDIALPPPRR